MSERLEKVKERQYELINLLPHDLYLDVYWLYEQTERVEELETLVQKLDEQRQKMGKSHQETIKNGGTLLKQITQLSETTEHTKRRIKRLEKQNQRYREMLESIAYSQFNVEPKRVVVKMQSKARQALEGDNNG